MEFKSSTDCVKSIIMNFMDGKDVVDRKEIVEAIRADSEGALVSEGVIAGSFKILVAQGYITPVQRGVYKRTGEEYQAGSSRRTTYEKKDVFENIEGIVKKFDRDLDKACTINPLNLDEEQRQKYSQTVDCLAYMRGSVHICAKELEGILHPKETNIDVEKEAALLREAFGLEAVQNKNEEELNNAESNTGESAEGTVHHEQCAGDVLNYPSGDG